MAWIFFNNAFLSIVQPPGPKYLLLVRSRVAGDIERVFPGTKVQVTPSRDYRFRALVPRVKVADAIRDQILAIDYGNFKNSTLERDRHDAYARVWSVMYRLQDTRAGVPRGEPWIGYNDADPED